MFTSGWIFYIRDSVNNMLFICKICDILITLWQGKRPNLEQGRNSNDQISNAISVQILPIEPQDQHQPIHRVPVSGLQTQS